MVEKIELNLKSLSDKTAAMSIQDKGRVLQYILMECKYGYIPDDEAEADQSIAARILEKGEDGKLHYRDIQDAVQKRLKYCESRKISRSFGKTKEKKNDTQRYAEFAAAYVNADPKKKLVPFEKMTARIKQHIIEAIKRESGNVDEALRKFTQDCEKAVGSSFLTGENERRWKADILFILSEHGSDGIRSGKYDNNKKRHGNFDPEEALEKATQRSFKSPKYGNFDPHEVFEEALKRTYEDDD